MEYPAMMDPELEELSNDLDPGQRRDRADKLERWVWDLRSSADLIEKCGLSLDDVPEPVEVDPQISEELAPLNRAEQLALAALLVKWAAQIRGSLGVSGGESHHPVSPARATYN
jgi:hypothetical protein